MNKTSYALQLIGHSVASIRKTLWVCTGKPVKFEEMLRANKNKILNEFPSYDFFVMKGLGDGGRFYELTYANDVKGLFQALNEEELKRISDRIKRYEGLDINEDPVTVSLTDIYTVLIGPMFHDSTLNDWIWNITKYRSKKTGRTYPGTPPMQMRYLEVYHPNGFFEVW